MRDLQTLYSEVEAVIDALPQRGVISDEVVASWINGIIRIDPDRAIWHAKRAGGIGGSEIGELLLEAEGEPEYLQSAESIVRSKLLLDLPQRAHYAMQRGTTLEKFVEDLYHHRTGTRSILDREDVARCFATPHKDYPFIVGNPDDVALTSDNATVIPDFKVRGQLDWSSRLNLVNICQVHWYGLLMQGNGGQTPDHFALAELDIPDAVADEMMRTFDNPGVSEADKKALTQKMIQTIDSLNMPGFGIRITAFDRNPELEDALISVAGRFWNNHVMTGNPYLKPGHHRKEDVPLELAQKVQALLQTQLANRLHERVAVEESKKTTEEIGALLEEHDFKAWPIDQPGISYSQTIKFDAEAAAAQLIARGHPRGELIKKQTEKLNMERAEATLREHGLLDPSLYDYSLDTTAITKAVKAHPEFSVEDFTRPAHRVALSTKKDDQEILKNLTNDVRRHIEKFDGIPQNPELSIDSDEPGEGQISGLRLA